MRLVPVAMVVAFASLVLAGQAAALECPQATIRERIDGANAVFVGTIISSRGVGEERIYRFDVAQAVKGPLGGEVEIRAPVLVDSGDNPVANGTDAGVFATLDGATFTTDSCGLTDPGALLAAADEPRGTWIKILVGIAILVAALVYSLARLRRKRQA